MSEKSGSYQAGVSFADGQKQPMPTNPATQRPASPPAVPPRTGITAGSSPTDAKPAQARQSPPLLPPRPGVTAKPSPTDAQVKSSTPFLKEVGRTDAKPKKTFVPPPGAVEVM